MPYSIKRLGDEHRRAVERRFTVYFQRELPEGWDRDAVFEQFWEKEYGPCRFEEVALGPEGALIVIGEVTRTLPIPPESFWTETEIHRWFVWPGGSRRGCVILHPGHPSLGTIIDEQGTCMYAHVAFVVRNARGEVLSWESYWYLDPAEGSWQIHGALINTMRGPYNCPI